MQEEEQKDEEDIPLVGDCGNTSCFREQDTAGDSDIASITAHTTFESFDADELHAMATRALSCAGATTGEAPAVP